MKNDKEEEKSTIKKEYLEEQYINLGRDPKEIATDCEIELVDIFRLLSKYGLLSKKYSKRVIDKSIKYQNEDWLRKEYEIKKREIKDIANELNVHSVTIHNWLKVFDIKIRGRQGGKWTNKDWMYHQYIELDKSYKEIAKICETTPSTINRWLKIHDIRKREENPIYTDRDWLYNQYLTLNKTTVEIADEFSIGRSTISNWLKKLKIPIKKQIIPRMSDKDTEEFKIKLLELLKDKTKTLQDIAKIFGITVTTLCSRAKKLGIETRNREIFTVLERKYPNLEEKLWELYWIKEYTYEKIAEELGITTDTILRYFNKFKIEKRKSFQYKRPSGLEIKFIKFLKKNNLPFVFTGTKSGEKLDLSNFDNVIWNNIYPDFKHTSKNIAIELGDKSQKGGKLSKIKRFKHWTEWMKEREKAYNSVGWKVIFVWSDEFKRNPEKILEDIKKVI